jgi:hypothetical protein
MPAKAIEIATTNPHDAAEQNDSNRRAVRYGGNARRFSLLLR